MQIRPEDIEMPKGVELRDFGDFKSARQDLYDRTKNALVESYPMKWGGVRMEIADVDYEGPEDFSYEEQKKAILEDRYLSRRLRGTVKLYDDKTNKLLDKQRLSLMRVPYLSNRGTFIHGGNEYTSIMQSRLLPGVYTRRQENGALETQFNLRQSRSAFRVGFEPETTQYRLKIGQANMHMYSLLKDLGVSDDVLKKRWGEDIFAANSAKYDARVFEKAYERLVPAKQRDKDASREEKAQQIKDALDAAEVNTAVMRKNLPNRFDMMKSAEWNARWIGRKMMIEKVASRAHTTHFKPDLEPADCFDALMDRCIHKVAGEEWDEIEHNGPDKDFNPDLKPNELKEQYSNIYGRMGSRLAGMDKWPAHWMPTGSNELGWLDWYFGYAEGKRSDDDDRQIKRWKSFKSRNLAQFLRNPTPRRAFSLRNWAIDPLLYVDGEARTLLRNQMDAYRTEKLNKAASVDANADTLRTLLDAKSHSDAGRYDHKHFLVQRSMMERPEEWIVDSPGGKFPGVTHIPTGFQLHVRNTVIPPTVQIQQTDAISKPEVTENVTQTTKVAAFDSGELKTLAQFLNKEHAAGLPLNVTGPELEQTILEFIEEGSVGGGVLETALAGAEQYRNQYQDMAQQGVVQPEAPKQPSVWEDATKNAGFVGDFLSKFKKNEVPKADLGDITPHKVDPKVTDNNYQGHYTYRQFAEPWYGDQLDGELAKAQKYQQAQRAAEPKENWHWSDKTTPNFDYTRVDDPTPLYNSKDHHAAYLPREDEIRMDLGVKNYGTIPGAAEHFIPDMNQEGVAYHEKRHKMYKNLDDDSLGHKSNYLLDNNDIDITHEGMPEATTDAGLLFNEQTGWGAGAQAALFKGRGSRIEDPTEASSFIDDGTSMDKQEFLNKYKLQDVDEKLNDFYRGMEHLRVLRGSSPEDYERYRDFMANQYPSLVSTEPDPMVAKMASIEPIYVDESLMPDKQAASFQELFDKQAAELDMLRTRIREGTKDVAEPKSDAQAKKKNTGG